MKITIHSSRKVQAQKGSNPQPAAAQPLSFSHRPDVGRRGPDPLEYQHRYASLRDYAQIMATFTLPARLRPLFFILEAQKIYALFFDAAAHALHVALGHRRSLGATTSGFTLALHTWNQRLLFHPHLHAIVPGAGLDANGRVVALNRSSFLAPKAVLQKAFRQRFKEGLAQLAATHDLPPIDPQVWQRDWGVKIQPFGDGQNVIKYLGAYVCRTAIGDSRIQSITDTHVSFTWKDRAHGNVVKTKRVEGAEFVRRYLRHVLPGGLKAVRHYGFCHPAAKAKRERVAFHTGLPLLVGAAAQPTSVPPPLGRCSHLPVLWPAHEVCAAAPIGLAPPQRTALDPNHRHRPVTTNPFTPRSTRRAARSLRLRSESPRSRGAQHPRRCSLPSEKPSVRPHPHRRPPALLPPSPADRFPLTDSRLPHILPSQTQNA